MYNEPYRLLAAVFQGGGDREEEGREHGPDCDGLDLRQARRHSAHHRHDEYV